MSASLLAKAVLAAAEQAVDREALNDLQDAVDAHHDACEREIADLKAQHATDAQALQHQAASISALKVELDGLKQRATGALDGLIDDAEHEIHMRWGEPYGDEIEPLRSDLVRETAEAVLGPALEELAILRAERDALAARQPTDAEWQAIWMRSEQAITRIDVR